MRKGRNQGLRVCRGVQGGMWGRSGIMSMFSLHVADFIEDLVNLQRVFYLNLNITKLMFFVNQNSFFESLLSLEFLTTDIFFYKRVTILANHIYLDRMRVLMCVQFKRCNHYIRTKLIPNLQNIFLANLFFFDPPPRFRFPP